MRTIYSTVCKLREMLRTEWSTHLSIHIYSTITEGAGQFVLLVIYTTMGAVPKATVIGHEGHICKLLNMYYSGSKNCPNVWLFRKEWSVINQINYIKM